MTKLCLLTMMLTACSGAPDPKQLSLDLITCHWDHETPVVVMPETTPGVCLRIESTAHSTAAFVGEWSSPCDVDDARPYLVVAGGESIQVWHAIGTPNDRLPVRNVDCETGAIIKAP